MAVGVLVPVNVLLEGVIADQVVHADDVRVSAGEGGVGRPDAEAGLGAFLGAGGVRNGVRAPAVVVALPGSVEPVEQVVLVDAALEPALDGAQEVLGQLQLFVADVSGEVGVLEVEPQHAGSGDEEGLSARARDKNRQILTAIGGPARREPVEGLLLEPGTEGLVDRVRPPPALLVLWVREAEGHTGEEFEVVSAGLGEEEPLVF